VRRRAELAESAAVGSECRWKYPVRQIVFALVRKVDGVRSLGLAKRSLGHIHEYEMLGRGRPIVESRYAAGASVSSAETVSLSGRSEAQQQASAPGECLQAGVRSRALSGLASQPPGSRAKIPALTSSRILQALVRALDQTSSVDSASRVVCAHFLIMEP